MSPFRSKARRSLQGRLQGLDLALLIGIVAVVVIVSLPRLSAFAQRENEADAQRLVRRLSQLFDDESLSSSPPKDTLDLFQRLPRTSRRQFEDQTIIDVDKGEAGGRSLLLWHGYYFEFVRVPSFAGDTQGVMAVRAWPERRTSAAAPSYYGFSGTAVLRNAALDPAPAGQADPPQLASPQAFELQARGWTIVTAAGGE